MCPKTKFVLVKMGKGDIAVKQQQQILDDKIDKSGCKQLQELFKSHSANVEGTER